MYLVIINSNMINIFDYFFSLWHYLLRASLHGQAVDDSPGYQSRPLIDNMCDSVKPVK